MHPSTLKDTVSSFEKFTCFVVITYTIFQSLPKITKISTFSRCNLTIEQTRQQYPELGKREIHQTIVHYFQYT